MSTQLCGCDEAAGWVCETHASPDLIPDILARRDRTLRLLLDDEKPLVSRVLDAQAAMGRELQALIAERDRIAAVLATFYRAPVSLSSLQPVLKLAEELNPSLVGKT